MMWSPDKIIGSKRALEEVAESKDESEGGNNFGEGDRIGGGSRDGRGSTHNEMELDEVYGIQVWSEEVQPRHAENNAKVEMAGELNAEVEMALPARYSPSKSSLSPATRTDAKAGTQQAFTRNSIEDGRGCTGTLIEYGSEADVVHTGIMAGRDFPALRATLGGHRHELVGDEADLPPKEAEETALVRWRNGLEAPAVGRADTATEGANRNEGSFRKVREEDKCPKEKTWDVGPLHRHNTIFVKLGLLLVSN